MSKENKWNRVIRVEESLWLAAKLRADEQGESLSKAIRDFLRRYSK